MTNTIIDMVTVMATTKTQTQTTTTNMTIATMAIKHEAFFKEMGARIAQARKERGLTQQQLADALGISQQTLAHYEVGRVGVGAPMLPRLHYIALCHGRQLKGEPSPLPRSSLRL